MAQRKTPRELGKGTEKTPDIPSQAVVSEARSSVEGQLAPRYSFPANFLDGAPDGFDFQGEEENVREGIEAICQSAPRIFSAINTTMDQATNPEKDPMAPQFLAAGEKLAEISSQEDVQKIDSFAGKLHLAILPILSKLTGDAKSVFAYVQEAGGLRQDLLDMYDLITECQGLSNDTRLRIRDGAFVATYAAHKSDMVQAMGDGMSELAARMKVQDELYDEVRVAANPKDAIDKLMVADFGALDMFSNSMGNVVSTLRMNAQMEERGVAFDDSPADQLSDLTRAIPRLLTCAQANIASPAFSRGIQANKR